MVHRAAMIQYFHTGTLSPFPTSSTTNEEQILVRAVRGGKGVGGRKTHKAA